MCLFFINVGFFSVTFIFYDTSMQPWAERQNSSAVFHSWRIKKLLYNGGTPSTRASEHLLPEAAITHLIHLFWKRPERHNPKAPKLDDTTWRTPAPSQVNGTGLIKTTRHKCRTSVSQQFQSIQPGGNQWAVMGKMSSIRLTQLSQVANAC